MMSSSSLDVVAVEEEELQALQRKLGKKQQFEEAVASISAILHDRYASSSPTLRKSIYSAVCRVATVLQTRYTTPGFWLAGMNLFIEAESLITDSSEKEHLKKCIARAREHLHEKEIEDATPATRPPDSRFLFEGHLTVEPEPAPPAWLVAQNMLTTLAAAQDLTSSAESSGNQENNSLVENPQAGEIPAAMLEILNSMQALQGDIDLRAVIEQSLQGDGTHKVPPASKEVVAKLPIITVTEEILARLGSETQCAVCRENLVVDDKMQELPCKHLFHPPCLKPWLDEHNSCPICRFELRTDDHAYESRKERDKEAEEERKGAANAVRGGEFMYI